MARINDSYLKLQAGYLFPEIGRRVKVFTDANPSASVIRLGIGDVTLPLAPAKQTRPQAFHPPLTASPRLALPGEPIRRTGERLSSCLVP